MYQKMLENWMRYTNWSIKMYLKYGDKFFYDMIKKDATRVFHIAGIILNK